jgi:hypothetical protein
MIVTLFRHPQRLLWFVFLVVFSATFTGARTFDDKLKPEEIVAKHIAAIGEAELLASVTTRVVTGTTQATFRREGVYYLEGNAVLASDGSKNLFSLFFDNPQYPYERLAYDGSKMTVAEITPGYRSTLGDFFLTRELPFKHGLIGGVLSSAWPFLKWSDAHARLESGGLKKINEREAYQIKYAPRKGSDLEIRLYFDKETFRHVRTTYEQNIAARQATTVDQSARQFESKYRVTEDYADFSSESGLTLPHSYKLELSITGQRGALVSTWQCAFTRFAFNQKIKPEDFNAKVLPEQRKP